MGRPNLYIHAGPGKTGTTFLQEAVFDKIKSARAISKLKIALGENMVQFGDMFDFSPRVWRALEEDPFVGDGSESGADVVISDEMIFGGLGRLQPWLSAWIEDLAESPVILSLELDALELDALRAIHSGKLLKLSLDTSCAPYFTDSRHHK